MSYRKQANQLMKKTLETFPPGQAFTVNEFKRHLELIIRAEKVELEATPEYPNGHMRTGGGWNLLDFDRVLKRLKLRYETGRLEGEKFEGMWLFWRTKETSDETINKTTTVGEGSEE